MSSSAHGPDRHLARRRGLYLALALGAMIIKLWVATTTVGSADIKLFLHFGRYLNAHSLTESYEGLLLFNHPPLVAYFIRWLYHACGANLDFFPAGLRAVGILADFSVALGMWSLMKRYGKPAFWALALFAVSPISLMVSGFHGNTDPVLTALLFFATVAAVHRRPLWAGALFALACQIKIVPLFLLPAFVAWWWAHERRDLAKFLAAAALGMVAGALEPLLYGPQIYAQKVLGYGGLWGIWGVPYLLRLTGNPAFTKVDYFDLSPTATAVAGGLKLVVVILVLALAWRRRKCAGAGLFTTLAASFVVFFAVGPSAAPQYMVWWAPFLLLANERWWAGLTAVATLFLFAFYHSSANYSFPWMFANEIEANTHFWGPWGVALWATFVGCLGCCWRTWWRGTPERVS